MKTTIAILTDSSSSLYNINHHYHNIFMIDIPCFVNEEKFNNFATLGNTPFIKALKNNTAIPKTSQPSIGETVDMYQHIKSLGYTDIIYLPISRNLSGTYENAFVAKEMVSGVNIHIVDTMTTVSILLRMTLTAALFAEQGKSVNDIITYIEEMKKKWGYYLTVDSLSFLVKNGRLSNFKGLVGNFLKIKPLITFTQEGKLFSLENVRTYKKAISAVVNRTLSEAAEDAEIHISVVMENEYLEYAKSLILALRPKAKIMVFILPATIISHLGLEAIGVGYINHS